MKKPIVITVSVVIFLLLFTVIYLSALQKQVIAPTTNMDTPKNATQSSSALDFTGKEDILKNALNLYIQKKQEGLDMSNGPCLGKIAEDWVLDIAHSPRQAVDDKPQNQCAEYRSGKVHHFIELDPNGKLLNQQ